MNPPSTMMIVHVHARMSTHKAGHQLENKAAGGKPRETPVDQRCTFDANLAAPCTWEVSSASPFSSCYQPAHPLSQQ